MYKTYTRKIHYDTHQVLKKVVMRVNFTIVFLAVSLIQVSAESFAQRLTYSAENTTLKSIFREITRQTGYDVVYALDNLNEKEKISVAFKDAPLETVLEACLDGLPVTYVTLDKTILIKRRKRASDVVSGNTSITKKHKQQLTVHGKITDVHGEPIPGVSVMVKETGLGTASDAEGNYRLAAVPEDATLVFSFLGYQTLEVELNGRELLNVTLQEDIAGLEEVVVVGYGTQRKVDLTGSVARADIESFRTSPNVNIAQSLQGTVPGLNIGQVDAAGENPSVSIRGRSTINGSQNVLVVVDGIIYNGGLNDLNPNDVESIDILKDPSSKAIYGAQAANGVILVTTRSGEQTEKPIFTYNGSFTTQTPSKALTMMDRDEFIQKSFDIDWQTSYTAPNYTELKPDWTYLDVVNDPALRIGFDNGTNYDWWDNATNTGYINDHTLGVSGSSKNLKYYLSGGYTKQKGFILNDEYERIAIRINIENQILDWFKIGAQTFGSFSDRSGNSPALGGISRMTPLVLPTGADGEYTLNPNGSDLRNPFLIAQADDLDKKNSLFGNFYLDVDIPFIEGLNYRLNYGNNLYWDKRFSSSPYDNGASGGAFKRNSSGYDWTVDHILTYKNVINNTHRLDITLVAGQRERKFEQTEATGSNYNNLRLSYNDLSLATIQNISSGAWDESYLYQMARLSYTFNYRYLLTATVRRDGFSGFARNEKTAIFPSVGIGWVLSEEPFFDPAWIESLKLRASYGANGNLVSRYSSLSRLDMYPAYVFGDGGSTLFGQKVQTLTNPNLTWETTTGLNFGIDFSLFENRLTGNLDYYHTSTNDLIFSISLPEITGFNEITSNVGEIANRGIEAAFDVGVIRREDLNWNIGFNISSNKNEIVSLVGLDADSDGNEDDLQASGLFIGESINSIFSYESAGIIQLDEEAPEGFFAGTHRIVDQNEDGRIDPNDRKIIGRQEPAYRFGILNELNYKNFTLRFFINSIQGGKDGYLGRNMLDGFGSADNIKRNNLWREYDYWTPANPDARYGRLDQKPSYEYIFYGDRSFIRLQDVTLAYRLDASIVERIGFQSLKIYLSGKNLATFTKWEGWDPETASGFEVNGRPVLKGFSIGLDMSF